MIDLKKGFSLMELMVVIIIMGLLASFVLPNLLGKSEEAKEKIVCIQMKSIAQTIKMYKLDMSEYPSTEDGFNILLEKKYFLENSSKIEMVIFVCYDLENYKIYSDILHI